MVLSYHSHSHNHGKQSWNEDKLIPYMKLNNVCNNFGFETYFYRRVSVITPLSPVFNVFYMLSKLWTVLRWYLDTFSRDSMLTIGSGDYANLL